MKFFSKKTLALTMVMLMVVALIAGCSKGPAKVSSDPPAGTQSDSSTDTTPDKPADPIEFTVTYPDNPTFPFDPNWLTVVEAQKRLNAKIKFEVIPYSDYNEKIQISLSSGTTPDVLLYLDASQGTIASFGLNGALVPVNKYENLTPYYVAQRDKWNLGEEVKRLHIGDGNLYFMPSLYSSSFYDGGPIIRTDLLEKYKLSVPKTYDDLYTVLKTFKQNDPSSYPLTILVEPRVLFRMTMPSFGISLGKNSSSGAYVLSYDYEKKEYFDGTTSDLYKEYLRYMARLYAEGLLDPEFVNPSDKWTTKLATGKSMATWAYYDQIGGLVANSDIEGISFNMLPPLEGPAGAHHQPKNRTSFGNVFPTSATKRPDFEQLVRTVDEMFYSPEMAELFCLGVEGVTFTKENGKVKFADELVNSPDGVYKTLQIKYGCGTDMLQKVWDLDTEMTKYDENYASINKTVAAMDSAIQFVPPIPKFDDIQAEEAGLIKAPLADAFEVWTNDFITGKKNVDKDWDAFVSEIKSKNIDKLLEMYNKALK